MLRLFPLNVLLISGPPGSGKTFLTLRLLSLHYDVITESVDTIYRRALQDAGIAVDPSADGAKGEALDVYATARKLRTPGEYDPETLSRFLSHFESLVRERLELADTLKAGLVLEGQTLKFSDEVSRVVSAAKAVSDNDCRVVRVNLHPGDDAEEPPKVEGVADFQVTDGDELRTLVDHAISIEKQQLSARRLDVALRVQGEDSAETRFQIKLAEVERAMDELHRLVRSATDLEERLSHAQDSLLNLSDVLASRERRFNSETAWLRARLRTSLEAVRDDVQRAAQSRSWRIGHRVAGIARMLVGRRPTTSGALDKALERIDQAPVPGPGELPLDEEYARRERAACGEFLKRYDEALRAAPALASEAVNLPMALDTKGLLRPAQQPGATEQPTVDVVVCVNDVPDDVRSCLWSLLAKSTYPFHLIVVDAGTDAETTSILARFTELHPNVDLITNPAAANGHDRGANLGLRASGADYVVVLHGDTVVTPGWLEAIVDLGESADQIGMIGPLSNAAGRQSIPGVRADESPSRNGLSPSLTPDGMAFLVDRLSTRSRPRYPILDGFCYAIPRRALERIGYFDKEGVEGDDRAEEEINDRVASAGLELAVADHAYVYHANSAGNGANGDRRGALDQARLKEKQREAEVSRIVERVEADESLTYLRERIATATHDDEALKRAFLEAVRDPLRVGFVLHGIPRGSVGGIHSIYQEAAAMRELGIEARLMVPRRNFENAQQAYPDADQVFTLFDGEQELFTAAEDLDVVVATLTKSIPLLESFASRRRDFLPAYYTQDYEPFLVESPLSPEEATSYLTRPGLLRFAKTHWLCNVVSSLHGVPVAKVEPSIDRSMFYPSPSARGRLPIRVAAMVRPRTSRRQALRTVEMLDRLRRDLKGRVYVRTFGCSQREFHHLFGTEFYTGHLGTLTRSEVADVLRGSDVFADLSIYQAFGRTALEAMACGCAAVVPAIGGASEFAAHGSNAVLADTTDEEGTYLLLADLVNDEPRIRLLQARGEQTARHYSALRSAISQYVLFDTEYRRRFPGRRSAGATAPGLAESPTG